MKAQTPLAESVKVFESWSHTYNDSIVVLMQKKFGADYADTIRRVANTASPRPGDKILDVATGTGTVALALSNLTNNTCHITGIDISESMLNSARDNVKQAGLSKNFVFQVASAEELPFESNSFDLVTSSLAIHHTKVMQVLKEMARVLKPGGRLTVADVTANPSWRTPLGLMFRFMDQLYMMGTESNDLFCEFHTVAEWEKMAGKLRLEDIKISQIPPKHVWSRGIVIIGGRKPLPN
ncbi:MAG: class I SAM-dependent methyltransferase [Firmicutes bacterium]|nr:class I SAM-dependent methyltransferase [Bacillota bacterium]